MSSGKITRVKRAKLLTERRCNNVSININELKNASNQIIESELQPVHVSTAEPDYIVIIARADRTAAITTTSCGLFRNEPYYSAMFVITFHTNVRALSLHVAEIIGGGTFGFRRRDVVSDSL